MSNPRPVDARRCQQADSLMENRLSSFAGDILCQEKTSEVFRYAFLNLNSIGSQKEHTKYDEVYRFNQFYNVDVFSAVEININWFQVPVAQSIWRKTRGWFEHQRVIPCWNQLDRSGNKHQYGGNLLLLQGVLIMTIED